MMTWLLVTKFLRRSWLSYGSSLAQHPLWGGGFAIFFPSLYIWKVLSFFRILYCSLCFAASASISSVDVSYLLIKTIVVILYISFIPSVLVLKSCELPRVAVAHMLVLFCILLTILVTFLYIYVQLILFVSYFLYLDEWISKQLSYI